MTKDEQGYNGWTNYPTWCVALWIDNDQYLLQGEVPCLLKGKTLSEAEDKLEAFFTDDYNPLVDAQASLYQDLLGWVLKQVNWHELAEHYMEELELDGEEEEEEEN